MRKLLAGKTIKPNVLIFYIAYGVFLVDIMFNRVLVFNDIITIIHKICLVLLAIACIFTMVKIPRKQAIIIFIMTLLTFLIWQCSGRDILLSLWLLIVASRNVKFDDIVKYDLLIKIPALIIIPALYFGGMTDVNLHYRDGIVRHSMGFSNPNVFSAYIMSVVAEVMYLCRGRIRIKHVIFAILMIVLIDFFADSRTSIVGSLAMLAIFLVNQKANKKGTVSRGKFKIFISFLLNHAFTIFFILSLALSIMYSVYGQDSILGNINTLTSNRIKYASEMLQEYPIKPFGQPIRIITAKEALLTGDKVQSLDNSYMYCLLTFGVVITILYCYFMKKYMQKTLQEKTIIRYIMLVFMFCGFMEQYLLLPQFNVFLLYFAALLYQRPEDAKEIDEGLK